MSMDGFLRFLQQILTMVDPDNPVSVEQAKTALRALISLARSSDKIDVLLNRSMTIAEMQFDYLVKNKAAYAGKPGHHQINRIRRGRLRHTIEPGC